MKSNSLATILAVAFWYIILAGNLFYLVKIQRKLYGG